MLKGPCKMIIIKERWEILSEKKRQRKKTKKKEKKKKKSATGTQSYCIFGDHFLYSHDLYV